MTGMVSVLSVLSVAMRCGDCRLIGCAADRDFPGQVRTCATAQCRTGERRDSQIAHQGQPEHSHTANCLIRKRSPQSFLNLLSARDAEFGRRTSEKSAFSTEFVGELYEDPDFGSIRILSRPVIS